MRRGFRAFSVWLCVATALAGSSRAVRAESILKDGDRLAIVGDSITEQKQYSVFIEAYLRMCQPKKVDVIQFGWSGETANGFSKRMKNDCLPFAPTIATTCYGMNDGRYRPITDEVRESYRKWMSDVVEQFKSTNTRLIIGSPGAVDTTTFKRNEATAEQYNQTLAALGAEGKAIADATGNRFANVNAAMIDAMSAAKKKYGQAYHVGGADGVHPAANGHLVMAYAFLKSMEFDGQIASIDVDLAGNTATASEHHKIQTIENGAVTIQSTQYPFCFGGDPTKTNATSGIIEFVPFNQDLNRFVLTVKNASAARYKITWGNTSREYSAEQLAEGVNLAADFIDNPFSEPFNVVERAIREKQVWETKMIKGLISSLGSARAQMGNDPAFDATEAVIRREHEKLTRRVVESIQPVTHTITIQAMP